MRVNGDETRRGFHLKKSGGGIFLGLPPWTLFFFRPQLIMKAGFDPTFSWYYKALLGVEDRESEHLFLVRWSIKVLVYLTDAGTGNLTKKLDKNRETSRETYNAHWWVCQTVIIQQCTWGWDGGEWRKAMVRVFFKKIPTRVDCVRGVRPILEGRTKTNIVTNTWIRRSAREGQIWHFIRFCHCNNLFSYL